MAVMICDVFQCRQCHHFFVFRVSTPELPLRDQDASEMETVPVVLSCPDCKHVYDYSGQKFESIPTPWGQPGGPQKIPVIFSVPLVCDEEDCRLPLQITAPRAAGTTKSDIETEKIGWTLHDLLCPNGHPITKAHK
jgi:hypothetical protein